MSSKKVYLAISAHIGDGALSCGPLLTQMTQLGHQCYICDLTPGERGHPRLTVSQYRDQKLQEAAQFADATGVGSIVFEENTDGYLEVDDQVALKVATLIRQLKVDVIVTHWVNSIHRDHANASRIAERARFLAGLPGPLPPHLSNAEFDQLPRHGVSGFYYAENWEDAEGFVPDTYVPISEQAHQKWLDGISTHAFARGETYGFRYIEYYDALMLMRGALAGPKVTRAVALASPTESVTVKNEL